MVLMLISGCRNKNVIEADKYAAYACNNSQWFITFFAGLSIAMIFYKNLKGKTETKKLKQKRKQAKIN